MLESLPKRKEYGDEMQSNFVFEPVEEDTRLKAYSQIKWTYTSIAVQKQLQAMTECHTADSKQQKLQYKFSLQMLVVLTLQWEFTT